ncbi:flavin reductase family protein [Micromonospora aurantiaca]|uniref:Flavin reductase n=1 Tax=Micromonospora aurantiaca (nom. illeg.) TaxID=47850 RepID=A0ABQ6ULN2_9ACTN|nr:MULTISPECIES: flavin reductase family protein [Micromonospora]ADU11239.1 flavin reductase domain protein FMN-binding protein [Micromonospora sp. L5]KAB1118065.1 flavin reductase [Micromonospora aurantiaca]MBC9002854.1 flavin reductase [Micromonospora aurantiaca]RNI05351.1 flavin reductase [Micromonospora aurantiaca]UFN97010.1 flavin reductase family protein [Micromonospora aurantiaca]
MTGTGNGQDQERAFRSVAGRFATGVAVATAVGPDGPVGMTVNSFTTVSLSPRMLLVCLRRDCRLLGAVRRTGRFAVTVLGDDQREEAAWFASRGRPAGADGFAGVAYDDERATGCPRLTDGVAYFGCEAVSADPAGDHAVLMGAVRSAGLLRPTPPLLFVDGDYAKVAAPREAQVAR